MTNLQIILLVAHQMINAYFAGMYFANGEDNEMNFMSVAGVIIYAIIGTEIMICFGLWNISGSLISYLKSDTMIAFYISYYKGEYDEMNARQLRFANENYELIKKKDKPTRSERCFAKATVILNKHLAFDYNKYKEELNANDFDESKRIFTVKK